MQVVVKVKQQTYTKNVTVRDYVMSIYCGSTCTGLGNNIHFSPWSLRSLVSGQFGPLKKTEVTGTEVTDRSQGPKCLNHFSFLKGPMCPSNGVKWDKIQ